MYKHHPQFHSLSDNNTVVWKYMDLFKYLHLLETKCLFFLRVDKYQDLYDGFMPDITSDNIPKLFEGMQASPDLCEALNKSYKKARSFSYANCWSICDHESSIMWDAYSKKYGGVSIKSTFQRLSSSIIDERDIHISPVFYNFPNIQIGNVYLPLFSKRPPFKDEREIRLFYAPSESVHPREQTNDINSVDVKVDLEILIEEVFFHPACPDWIAETIGAVIARYNEKWRPVKSTLYQ